MSIATEKELAASNRYTLVRVEPGRYINDDLSLVSGSLYEVIFTDITNVPRLQRNGSDLTEVTTISGNDEWTFDEDTKTLQVQLASAPNVDTNVLVVFHYLFFTSEKHRFKAEDPLSAVSTSNPIRDWLPRLSRDPQIDESFRNILNGVFTVKGSGITLINTDQLLNSFLTVNDSFKNKTIDIYIGINDELEQLFSGPCEDPRIQNTNFTLKFRDAFDLLQQTATFGDSYNDRHYNFTDFADLDPSKENDPIPMVMGKGSGILYVASSKVATSSTATLPMNPQNKAINIDFMLEAANIEYQSDDDTVNDEFVACRFPSTQSIETQTIGTFVRSTTEVHGGTKTVHYYQLTGNNLKVGQTFKWDDGGGPYYSTVQHIEPFSFGGLDYNVMVANNGGINLSDPVMSTGSEFRALAEPVVIKFNGDKPASFDPKYTETFLRGDGDQFSTTTTTTTGGHKLLKISITATNIDINPEEGDKLLYQVHLSGDVTHGETMGLIVTSAGLTKDSASFTQADVDLVADARFQVPLFGQTKLEDYKKYAEFLAQSTLGFLSQSSTGDVKYTLLDTPAGGSVRDKSLILDNSASVSYQYGDVISSIEYNNLSQTIDIYDGDTKTTSISSNKSRYLNEQVKVFTFSHVLDDITGRIQDIFSVRKTRQAVYSFRVATEDIDSELGDDLTVESDKITVDGSENVKIISIRKSPDSISVQATDLGEL